MLHDDPGLFCMNHLSCTPKFKFCSFFLSFFGFSLLGLLVLCSDAETPAVGFWHGARAPLQISSTEGKRVTPKHLDLMADQMAVLVPCLNPGFEAPSPLFGFLPFVSSS